MNKDLELDRESLGGERECQGELAATQRVKVRTRLEPPPQSPSTSEVLS